MGGVVDVIAGALLIFGSALILLAGVGVARFESIYARMHSAAKAPTLGILAIAVGVGLAIGSVSAFVTGLLVVVLQMITGPVGSHLLGRAVYRTVKPPLDGIDELAGRDLSDD
ncbi:MAG: Na(+)/H(+) antiporter subunit [Actinomycetota bacterium]|jgi:multicomponent Na+:H+ antiporter subunit G